jgi:hypothetical protein
MDWSRLMDADTLLLSVHSANLMAIEYYLQYGFEEKFKLMSIAL